MTHNLHLFNTLTRKKEKFEPLAPPFVGLYVCGPTVYGDPHLGHARPAVAFDVVFRYLQHIGYRVRYVRNITDVGHLVNDADSGEDKIAKKARLEQLEPMEIAQLYTNSYQAQMRLLNVLSPSIEPRASGHIIEQITMVQQILDAGFAYESNGSVYFDVPGYSLKHNYGALSGRKLDDQLTNTRDLDGQSEKLHPADFALWKKASEEHIMRWPSPWSVGFPGWHLECSAMGAKYLGETFDIHGGGMDLLFPHHECEIAQSVAARGKQPVHYWMHNNLITINGQKMGKSLGNFINLEELFSGSHALLTQAYSPMTIRFFMLQAHYRGTLDFSNEALTASGVAYLRLSKAFEQIDSLKAGQTGAFELDVLIKRCYEAMDDDFNTPMVLAELFEASRIINSVVAGQASVDQNQIDILKSLHKTFYSDILGLITEGNHAEASDNIANDVLSVLAEIRLKLKEEKNFALTDAIRDKLKSIGIVMRDTKEGTVWEIENN